MVTTERDTEAPGWRYPVSVEHVPAPGGTLVRVRMMR
jgi:hypothetical protein